MVNYASGLMKLVDVEVFGNFGCELTYLTACDKPYDLEVKPSNIRLLTKYFPQKFGFVGESSKGKGKGKGKGVKCKGKLKAAPKKATKKDKDDALKMRLIYFATVVLIRVKSNMGVNLAHLDLVEDMNRFNTYS
ncbi:unnamed protein product [Malus baccata var. baccata]